MNKPTSNDTESLLVELYEFYHEAEAKCGVYPPPNYPPESGRSVNDIYITDLISRVRDKVEEIRSRNTS